MPNSVPFCTRFRDENNVDLGNQFVEQDYLIEVYPNIVPWMKSPGLFLWGCGSFGGLGDNTTITKNSDNPVQTISAGSNWKQVSTGQLRAAAIKTDGTLWLWGYNYNGQLGDNTTVSKSSPVQTVSGGTDWKQVNTSSESHSAAIKTDGTLWLWGDGGSGKLGDNTTVSKSSPVQTVSGGTNWKQVSLGDKHSAAIKTDGTLWLWGSNYNGQLGNNANTSVSSPVQTISGGTDWKQVSLNQGRSAAIKTDGTLWLWGFNSCGFNSVSSPVQTISGGTDWKQVSLGSRHSAAIKTDGTLWLWGRNYNGRLGDNTTVDTSSPIQTISGGTNWKQVSIGTCSFAIKTDGTLWSWGNGQSSPVRITSGGNSWKQIGGTHFSTVIAGIREFECW